MMKMRTLLILGSLLLGGCSINPYSSPFPPVTQPSKPTQPPKPVMPPPALESEVSLAKPMVPIGLAQALADRFVQAPEVQALAQSGNAVLLLTPPRDSTDDGIDTALLAATMGKQIAAKSGIRLVEPGQVAAITGQLEYQQGGINPAALVRLGRQTGAGYLLYGELATQGRGYRLMMTLMDLRSGELLWDGSRSTTDK